MARELRRPMAPERAIARAATRQARPSPAPVTEQVRALEARYGREGARERLGVSARTMRRYRAGGRPSKANAAKIARQAQINPRREVRLRSRGAYVRMSGKVGGGTPGARRKNTRQRTIGAEGFESVHLSGEDMSEILDRWEAGDDEGALEALRDAIRETPWGSSFGNFEFEDLTRLEFRRDDPNA
jgi:hypothetical protein